MRHFLFSVFFLTQLACFGQISEDFSDGDFTTNPTWSGTDADFTINASNQLQLDNWGNAATSYLSTAHNLTNLDDKEWRFWTRQSFSPSSANYGRIYLTSNSADLSSDPDGFYLQLGEAGSTDAIRLIHVETGLHAEIAAGPTGQIASSFIIGIRVVRDNLGNWSVYVDPAGGTNYGLIASATDPTNLLGTHSGILDVYTSTNSTDFYYDDIYIGDEIVDTDPPVLVSATTIDDLNVDALFDEVLDPASAMLVTNYSIVPPSGVTQPIISNIMLDGINPALVHINISSTTPLQNGEVYTLSTSGIADIEANVSGIQTTDFAYLIAEIPEPGDVIINEVMFDVNPIPAGQPEVQYVEIYNRSSKIFNVQGWKLKDNSASSNGTLLEEWLLPDSFLVLTKTGVATDSFPLGFATGVSSFPTFNISGDDVVLLSNTLVGLDSVSYTDDWLNGIIGGVSIELVNPLDPCSNASDWMPSTHSSGGTPKAQNSVYDISPDITNPEIASLLAIPLDGLEIQYNEGMDSTTLATAIITITPSLGILNNFVATDPSSTQLLQFDADLVGSQTYTIEIQNVGDCWGNTTTLFGEFTLPELALSGDLIINELLVDPVSGGKDWIEIYNTSNKLIDLYNYQIADFDDDTIANFKLIDQHILIEAGEYVVLGEDISQIGQYYSSVAPDNLYEMDLPSYSNDSGTVYLISNNSVMDRVAYQDDWHFQLLDNTDGVSLERIDPKGGSSDRNNWHSAAEAVGFGTPGLQNSQFYPAIVNGEFNFTNDVVSPDNDGYQDVLQINYEMTEPGYVGHFTVYDDRGRLIKRVVESELLASSGTFSWDGLKEDGTKTSIGTYVGVFEAFQLEGGVVFTKKKAFVVAGKI